jgi:hypothetical protein
MIIMGKPQEKHAIATGQADAVQDLSAAASSAQAKSGADLGATRPNRTALKKRRPG